MKSLAATVLTLFILCAAQLRAAQPDDLDTQIVLATFKISNPKSTATVFVVSRPAPDDAQKTQYILVTAGHVFTKMEGDEATLILRKKDGDAWSKSDLKIKVRADGKTLWTKHPNSDVSVLPFTPPADAPVQALPLSVLASEEQLKQYELHPGDTMKCAGYPHPNQFEPNAAWFPVVRQGCIASYPLTPVAKNRTFLCDFSTFEGNSGGPVYFTDKDRFYGGKQQPGRVQLVLGLLSSQHFLNEKFEHVYESGTFRQRLDLGVIVHAAAIREAIEMIPKTAKIKPPEETKAAEK